MGWTAGSRTEGEVSFLALLVCRNGIFFWEFVEIILVKGIRPTLNFSRSF
jgi:hypothetical protein